MEIVQLLIKLLGTRSLIELVAAQIIFLVLMKDLAKLIVNFILKKLPASRFA